MTLETLNVLPSDEAETLLLECCGSRVWARRLVAARPFEEPPRLFELADAVWWSLGPRDWLEAFAAHPRIGARLGSGEAARATVWSNEEQAGARRAAAATLGELAAANDAYEAHFGHLFIVCAAGRSGEEMLAVLRDRMRNDPETELRVAAGEQARITRLRLEKLLTA